MRSPIEFFFSIGDRVTKGDPVRKAKFDYYLMWIMFFAFVLVLTGYMKSFIRTMQISYLGWSLFALVILWFQYYNLKQYYMILNTMLNIKKEPPVKIDSVKNMLQEFK